MTVAPNRAVAALTPLLFAPAAGAISVLIAKHAPGVSIDSGSLEAIFVAGATIAFAKAGLWLKGWQDYEKREQLASQDAEATLFDEPSDEPLADPFDELEDVQDIDEDEPDADELDADELDADELDADELDDIAFDEDAMLDSDEDRNRLSRASVQGA